MRALKTALVLPVTLLLAAVAAPATPAAADEITPGTVARLTLSRSRRAIALGPFVGLAPAMPLSGDGDADAAFVFGLNLSLFDVPIVPNMETIKGIIFDKAKQRLAEIAKQAMLSGKPLSLEEQRSLLEEIVKAVRDEFFRERRGRTLEKPRGRLLLEVGRYLDGDVWDVRLTGGIGVWKVCVGPTLGVRFGGGDTQSFAGGELSLQITPTKGPRSHIVDLFLRADWNVTGDGADVGTVGVRLVLDII